jgi:hypothetical protein
MVSFLNNFYTEAQTLTQADFQNISKAGNLFLMRDGIPVLTKSHEELMDGSPYFSDEWKKAYLVLADKQVFKDIKVRLNLLNSQVHYLDARGKEMVPILPIKEIFLTDSALDKNYRFVHYTVFPAEIRNRQKGWYLWLLTGGADLYKMYSKSLNEQRIYGSATTRQFIETREKYFVLYDDEFYEIKKPKDLIKNFPQRSKQLEEFSKKINTKLSTEDQLVQMVEFFNSIK